MFCPKCGYQIDEEEACYCPSCGSALPGRAISDTEHIQNGNCQEEDQGQTHVYYPETVQPIMEDRRYDAPYYMAPIYTAPKANNKKKNGMKIAAALVAAIMIMSCAFVAFGNSGNGTDDGSGETTTVVGEYTYTVNGAFSEGIFSWDYTTHEFNGEEKECVEFILNEDVASQYTYFVWTLYDNDSGTSSRVAKEEAVLYWSSCEPGDYTVKVACYTTVNANGSGTVYSGDFSVDGDITTEYSWTYSGNSYEFSVTYDYGDYKYYATLDTDSRAVTNYSLVTNFVTDSSGTVQEIANNLISLYQEKYGSNADITGQDFANFILAFVQYCYTYTYDSVTYGQDEYFAYPMETIYQSGGDCEDTSILAAAVYEAAGYDAAVGLLPGHAIVGVALSDYDTPTYSNAQEILSQTVDGETYYAGETTATYFIALGVMGYYSSEHGSYSWYSDYLGKGQYGFYPVE